jgi:flavin reductase (DIM6/NTAB) family NADH-FMN oxidoreductase RutF
MTTYEASTRIADGEDLRSVMRSFPTGVALLRTGEGARSVAMTISTLISVSLAPPQVLVSMLHTARAHPVLEDTGTFTAHLLAGHQAEVAKLFASVDKPAGDELSSFLDTRVAPGVLASLDCAVAARYPGGDHSLFLGRVNGIRKGDAGGEPLIFHNGTLRGIGER